MKKRRTPKEKRKTKTDLTFLDTEEVTWLKYVHVLRGWYINTVICTLSFSFDAFQIIPMRIIQRSSNHMYIYVYLGLSKGSLLEVSGSKVPF